MGLLDNDIGSCYRDGDPLLAIAPCGVETNMFIKSVIGRHLGNTSIDCDGVTYTVRFCVVGVIDTEIVDPGVWCCCPPENIYEAIYLAGSLETPPDFFNYNDKLPALCDSMSNCRNRGSGPERAVAISLYRISRDCMKQYWDVTFTDRLLGGERAYRLLEKDSLAGIKSIPIYDIEDLSDYSTRVSVSYSQTRRLVELAEFNGFVNLTTCSEVRGEDADCTDCSSAPLAKGNALNKQLVPQNAAGTPFVPGLTADGSEIVITLSKPFVASDLCLLDSWTNIVNSDRFWVIEYPAYNAATVLPSKCIRVDPFTAKIERPVIEEVKFCCQPVNMVSISLKIKHQRCMPSEGDLRDYGWKDLVANVGLEEWDCEKCATSNKVITSSNRSVRGKRWLDPCGKLIKEDATTDSSDNATGKQVHGIWNPYALQSFSDLLGNYFGAIRRLKPKDDVCLCYSPEQPAPPTEGAN